MPAIKVWYDDPANQNLTLWATEQLTIGPKLPSREYLVSVVHKRKTFRFPITNSRIVQLIDFCYHSPSFRPDLPAHHPCCTLWKKYVRQTSKSKLCTATYTYHYLYIDEVASDDPSHTNATLLLMECAHEKCELTTERENRRVAKGQHRILLMFCSWLSCQPCISLGVWTVMKREVMLIQCSPFVCWLVANTRNQVRKSWHLEHEWTIDMRKELPRLCTLNMATYLSLSVIKGGLSGGQPQRCLPGSLTDIFWEEEEEEVKWSGED